MAKIQAEIVEQGVWIRPFGKLIYIMPPYIINEQDIAQLCEAIYHVVSNIDLNSSG